MEQRVVYLTERYLSQTATAEELEEFFKIVRSAEENEIIMETLSKGWVDFSTEEELPASETDSIFNNVLRKSEGLHKQQLAKIIRMKIRRRIAAAAAILLILGTAGYFAFFNKPANKTGKKEPALAQDIKAPQINRAMISLANGKKIYLDSASIGSLAKQGAVNILKLADGQIAYSGTANQTTYNTLINPKGSKVINITLADGSRVWLNAGSSLTYPVAFLGKERKVSITGEAYFEVSKDPGKKFLVEGNQVTTEVLGTHFNVNTYADESNISITLLEGSVRVRLETTDRKAEAVIQPGEQAQVTSGINILKAVDTAEVMAWMNGKFVFNKTDVQTIMRQMARWYDVDIIYHGEIKGFFSGSISRKENALEVLKMLGMTDEVHFDIEGRKVIVEP